MMFGLGVTTTSGTGTSSVPAPGFTDGLKLWTSPTTALSMLGAAASSPSAALTGPFAPFTFGILAVPIAILAVVLSMSGNGGGGGAHHR